MAALQLDAEHFSVLALQLFMSTDRVHPMRKSYRSQIAAEKHKNKVSVCG